MMRHRRINRRAVELLFLGVVAGCSQAPLPIIHFPPPPAQPQMIYLGRIDQAPIDPPLRGSLRRWLGDAGGFLQTPLARPFGLACQGHRLYVCDPPTGGLTVIDYDEQDVERVEELGKPVAVAADDSGNLFVADARAGRIHVLNRALQKQQPIMPPGAEFRPVALAAGGQLLFVADMAGKCVRAFDLAASKWRDPLLCAAPLGFPAGVCMMGQRLWVVDALDGRLLVADLPLGPLRVVTGPSHRLRPKHLSTDGSGRLLVTDAALQQLDLINSDGQALTEVADPSILPLPSGVCASRELLTFYSKRLPSDFRAAALVFVSNQSAPPGIAVFALAATER